MIKLTDRLPHGVKIGQVFTHKDIPRFQTPTQIKEAEDHEVSMAHNSLDTIIQMATELKSKLGQTEKNIPAWIQDHITNAENFISQATTNYHEYNEGTH